MNQDLREFDKMIKNSLYQSFGWAASLAVCLFTVTPTQAQTDAPTWPNAPINLVIANSPGSATDLAARIFAESLGRQIGQGVIVQNRPGADGYIAAEFVARASPDGYTLFFASQSLFGIDPNIKKVLPLSPERDFTPIAMLIDDTGAIGLFVNPSLPVNNVQDLINYGKAKPNTLSYASIVPLFSIMGAWVSQRTRTPMLEVKYKSAPQAVQDVLSGVVPVYLDALGSMEAQMKAGKIRLIALSQRVDDYASTPTFATLFGDYHHSTYISLVGPASMNNALVDRINKSAAQVVEAPKFNQDLSKLRWRNNGGARTPQKTAEWLQRSRMEWGTYISEAGIKPE
jgi:tripartite-type tricarboxylate transporter receptor subunit TctC